MCHLHKLFLHNGLVLNLIFQIPEVQKSLSLKHLRCSLLSLCHPALLLPNEANPLHHQTWTDDTPLNQTEPATLHWFVKSATLFTHTHRHTTHTHRQTDRHRHTHRDRHTDRNTHTHTRQTDKHRHTPQTDRQTQTLNAITALSANTTVAQRPKKFALKLLVGLILSLNSPQSPHTSAPNKSTAGTICTKYRGPDHVMHCDHKNAYLSFSSKIFDPYFTWMTCRFVKSCKLHRKFPLQVQLSLSRFSPSTVPKTCVNNQLVSVSMQKSLPWNYHSSSWIPCEKGNFDSDFFFFFYFCMELWDVRKLQLMLWPFVLCHLTTLWEWKISGLDLMTPLYCTPPRLVWTRLVSFPCRERKLEERILRPFKP